MTIVCKYRYMFYNIVKDHLLYLLQEESDEGGDKRD